MSLHILQNDGRDHLASNVSKSPAGPLARADRPGWDCDPLESDAAGDELVVTTTRRLLRLSIAATDVGARFTREGLRHDPAAWMIAPRMLFGGRAAIDACQELEHFHRAIVMHGVGMGVDARPEDVDALLVDRGRDDAAGVTDVPERGHDAGARGVRSPRCNLFTAWVDFDRPDGRLFAFCAVVTDRAADLVDRVVGRYGADAAAQARYATGFNHSEPLATAMVSDAMADTLALAAADPDSPLARGLDVVVEQRFVA